MIWALRNIGSGLARVSLWSRLAFVDIEVLYKRSLFGLAWVALAFALFIFVKILIFGSITIVDERFFAIWLGTGFWLWTLFQSLVVDGSRTFLYARGWILGTRIPLSVYAIKVAARSLIRFSFSLPVIIALILVMRWTPTTDWLWSIAGLLVIILNGLWVTLFFGTVSSRYNDLIHLTQSVMQVTFFLTPILYVPEQLGENAYLLQYNPFTHFLAIIRDPILGNGLPILSWQVVGAITVVGWVLTLIAFSRMGRKIAFYIS
ncbi:MAG: hypothetical protein WBF53_15490 [Litorimonas sp.]